MDERDEIQENSGQYVMFELAGEVYGIELEIVQEVIRVSEITTVPRAPEFIEGVINLRGFFIPVVDMRKRFGMGSVEHTRTSRIMVLEIAEQIVGMLVDRVSEVITLNYDSIEPPSQILQTSHAMEYLSGFTEVEYDLVKILDLDKVFSFGEIAGIDSLETPEDMEIEETKLLPE